MKTAFGCKLLGAHQALLGVRDGLVLLHSVVGCNFGSMAFHFAACHMEDVRQTCTVLSDHDVVFSGEASLGQALHHARELYAPEIIFLVTGCVSDIIQDDVRAVARAFEAQCGTRVIPVEAAGYRGDFNCGYEAALLALAEEMRPEPPAVRPTVNLLGLGADDPRLEADLEALRALLGGKAEVGAVFSDCTLEEVRRAPRAGLNLVFGRGLELAREMERRFGVPYACLDYPYGLTGARALWDCLARRFALDFSAQERAFAAQTAESLGRAYSYLQALYGVPAAVIGAGARARGMAGFLSRELGMEVELLAAREELEDIEDFYEEARAGEAAVLFGSSFEQELADRMEIPLVRFDFPVFDRVCLTPRPYVGAAGTACLVEDMLNEVMQARRLKGALYQ